MAHRMFAIVTVSAVAILVGGFLLFGLFALSNPKLEIFKGCVRSFPLNGCIELRMQQAPVDDKSPRQDDPAGALQ